MADFRFDQANVPLINPSLPFPEYKPLTGLKFDDNKPRMDLIPPELLTAVAIILTFGAKKYGDRNWEKGMDWGRPYSALLRHLLAWHGGEDKDPETGLSHLWHVATNAAFLLTYEERKIGNDNRPTRA